MMNLTSRIFFSVICLAMTSTVLAQRSFNSETFIQYNLSTHKTSKPIPFDHAFTLTVNKVPNLKIIGIEAYQAVMDNGTRRLKTNIVSRALSDTVAVYDMRLNYKYSGDTLDIYFPPLKPGVLFDINIISNASDACKLFLLEANANIFQKYTINAKVNFIDFLNCTRDSAFNRRNGNMDFDHYESFATQHFKAYYDVLADSSKFTLSPGITLDEIVAIENYNGKSNPDIATAPDLVETTLLQKYNAVQLGLLTISEIASKDNQLYPMSMPHLRMAALDSNIIVFRNLLRRVDRIIAGGTVSTSGIRFESIREKILRLINSCNTNRRIIYENLAGILNDIDENKELRQGIYLVGNTESSDLKSAGGNILFVDAGLAQIVLPETDYSTAYMPTPYVGLSIYFRPIDKNTRRGYFRKNFSNKNISDGPDYGIASRYSIWQHLSLNVGLTLAPVPNDRYENLFGNTSLMVGPSYRFARAFKASAGAAFLKHSSDFATAHQMAYGYYIALSVDIDFIQAAKDFTDLLLK